MSAPIFERTLRVHGLMVEPRPLGAVSVGLSLIDAPQPRLIDGLTRMLRNTLCRRCDGVPESNRTCAACCNEMVAAAEIAMREDDESHANECARYDAAWSAPADDEWGDL